MIDDYEGDTEPKLELDYSNIINLSKKTINLSKEYRVSTHGKSYRLFILFDECGDMQDRFDNEYFDSTFNSLIQLYVQYCINEHNIKVYRFLTECYELTPMNGNMTSEYLDDNLVPTIDKDYRKWSYYNLCKYSKALETVYNSNFGDLHTNKIERNIATCEEELPKIDLEPQNYLLVVCCGNYFDFPNLNETLKLLSDEKLVIQFLIIGDKPVADLQKLAELYENVSVIKYNNIKGLTTKEKYDIIFKKYSLWVEGGVLKSD